MSEAFERLRLSASSTVEACEPLMDGMLRDRGIPDYLHDHPGESGVATRSWWYASEGYSVLFKSSDSSCDAEDFRFPPASEADVADYLQLLPGVTSVPAGELMEEPPEDDVNRSTFDTREEAQRTFDMGGSDGLDADNDGIACEDDPRFAEAEPPVEESPPPMVEEPVVEPPMVEDPVVEPPVEEPPSDVPTLADLDDDGDVNCSDFETRGEAQRFFEANRPDEDPFRLDANSDGQACESLPRASL